MSQIKMAVGLMSGTSMDGIDAALLRTDGMNIIENIGHCFLPYSAFFREKLKVSLNDASQTEKRQDRPGTLAEIERELTLQHVLCVHELLNQLDYKPEEIDIIGFHGQTVLHKPDIAMTVQLGDGALLANQCAIDVVYDMRANDMVHGGQGAPLVPAYHVALAEKLQNVITMPVVFLNIGGISNLTLICPDKLPVAFDCGPGNALLDQWMYSRTGRSYDHNGETALKGKVQKHILDEYLSHKFFEQWTTKSLDWRDFSPLCDKNITTEDGAATLVKLTTLAISNAIRHLPRSPKTIIVSGGGANNQAMLASLAEDLKDLSPIVATAETYGLNGAYIEAEAWAYLAVRSMANLPLTYPQTTGCHKPVTGGVYIKHRAS